MLDAASENGFRCSMCRPQGNANNDAFSILLCDYAMLSKSALDYLHGRYGGTLFRCPLYGDSYYEFPSYMFAPKSYPFEGKVCSLFIEKFAFRQAILHYNACINGHFIV